MTACILCTKDSTIVDSFYLIDQEIAENYRIQDSIIEHFQCSDLILSDQSSNLVCITCFNTLKSFKELQSTVSEAYSSLQYDNAAKEPSTALETEVEEEHLEYGEDEIISEEYLEEEIDGGCDQIGQAEASEDFKADQPTAKASRRKHPANDVEGEQKIRDLVHIKCHICDNQTFESFFAMCQHFKRHHPNERAFVTCCDKKFTQRSLLLEHLEYHDKSRVHRCEICSKDFKTAAIRKSHMRNFHRESRSEQPVCLECGKTFTNKYILKTHMRKHIVDETRTFECYICGRAAKNLELLREHLRNKHSVSGQRSSVCHICSKIVTRLDIHFRQVHADEPVERVKCDICGHWLKRTSLKGHMAGHGESGFSCEICGKFLKNKNTYFCHMKRVHTEGKFRCEFCEKSFHSEGRLVDHVACQHTGKFLHQCRIDGCEKMFRNAGRRRMHERRMHPTEYERDFKPMYLRDHADIQQTT